MNNQTQTATLHEQGVATVAKKSYREMTVEEFQAAIKTREDAWDAFMEYRGSGIWQGYDDIDCTKDEESEK